MTQTQAAVQGTHKQTATAARINLSFEESWDFWVSGARSQIRSVIFDVNNKRPHQPAFMSGSDRTGEPWSLCAPDSASSNWAAREASWGLSRETATPGAPARPVRPTRCTYASTVGGGCTFTTVRTPLKSMPLRQGAAPSDVTGLVYASPISPPSPAKAPRPRWGFCWSSHSARCLEGFKQDGQTTKTRQGSSISTSSRTRRPVAGSSGAGTRKQTCVQLSRLKVSRVS